METSEKNNIGNNKLEQELITASLTGDFETVRLLLESDLNRNTRNAALTVASENNQLYVVQLLLEKGADPNYADLNGTELALAIQEGLFDIVHCLFEKQPELLDLPAQGRIVGSNAQRALIAASSRGHFSMVCYLLDKRPTLFDDLNVYNDDTPLHVATRAGHLDIIQYLLKQFDQSDKFFDFLDREDLNGDTALMIASAIGNIETVHSLLKYGANPNYVDKQSQTALFMAVRNHKTEIVHLLLSRGAIITQSFNVNVQHINGRHVSVPNLVQGIGKLSLISNFFERNPELSLIYRNQDQTVRDARKLDEIARQIVTVNEYFFTFNPKLKLMPTNLKQAVTETFIESQVISQAPVSEIIRSCQLIRPYYGDTSAYVTLTEKKLVDITPTYRTILAVLFAFKANLSPTNKDLVTAQDNVKQLPADLMFLIIKQAMQDCLARGLARMACQCKISETLLTDMYHAWQRNAARLNEFYQAVDKHDWREPWVRSTADNILNPGMQRRT